MAVNEELQLMSLILPYLLDYAPPFLHRSSAKKKGGRLIEVCTNAPSLRPPTQRYKMVSG